MVWLSSIPHFGVWGSRKKIRATPVWLVMSWYKVARVQLFTKTVDQKPGEQNSRYGEIFIPTIQFSEWIQYLTIWWPQTSCFFEGWPVDHCQRGSESQLLVEWYYLVVITYRRMVGYHPKNRMGHTSISTKGVSFHFVAGGVSFPMGSIDQFWDCTSPGFWFVGFCKQRSCSLFWIWTWMVNASNQ